MTPSCIARANGYPASLRSENTAPSCVGAIWRTITGLFRSVSSTSDDVALPDNQRYSATPSTDLKDRDVKGTSLSPLVLPGTDDHAKTFKETVRRIKKDQHSLIMEKVNAITTPQLEQIAQCCRKPEQITTEQLSFLKSETFAYAALRAFREKKISSNEFATLVTLQGVYLEGIQDIDSFKIEHNKLFDDNGEVNEYAWKVIEYSLKRSQMFFPVSSYNVNSIIRKMQLLLKNAPAVEAGFWSCEFPISKDEDQGQRTMKKALSAVDFHVLFLSYGYGAGWMLCPSITLRQAFIDSYCQEEAHKINPVIGVSSPEDIRIGSLKGYRDMAIPFPGHPLPKTADHFSARWILVFMQHDLYHAVLASMLKNADIHLIIAIADVVRKIKVSFNNEYLRVTQLLKDQEESFEHSISNCSLKHQKRMRKDYQKNEAVVSIKNTLEYLKRARKALGQLAFNLVDLDTHNRDWRIHPNEYDRRRFDYHLLNILYQLNRSPHAPWREFLSETEAGIVGQYIIPMIVGNLSNPQEFYSYYCREIEKEVNSYSDEVLPKKQKNEYIARSLKLIEPLKPSVKLDQSQWPTFLRETMIDDK
ncbi:hypothetical protein [Salinisphaera sp. G21_0]|nr:hypothetical protein [Salinisphaera sp. G21_0]MBO9496230.1 hypothetical protein [Thalassotalea sp. G20_0]